MSVQPARRIACPRCSAPVTGEFKFCPTCAYRLLPGPDALVPPLPASRGRIAGALALTGVLAVGIGLLAFGVRLFRSDPGPSAPRRPVRLARPITVEDIPSQLVDLRSGSVYYKSVSVEVPASRFMQYEVTRGQWEEFVRDLEADPKRVPLWLRAVWQWPEYVDDWWLRAAAHLRRLTGREMERPKRLILPIDGSPLDDATALLLLVPPSWTYLTISDDIAWRLPRDAALGPLPENLPVAEISWFDAVAFSDWVSDRLGLRLYLPTETRWRRAAHGSDPARTWPWGDDVLYYACDSLNYWGDKDPEPVVVDYLFSDEPGTTDEGLFGMAGNVSEWVYPEAEGKYDEIDVNQKLAPAYGGSFREGVVDCSGSSNRLAPKYERKDDRGFRLMYMERR